MLRQHGKTFAAAVWTRVAECGRDEGLLALALLLLTMAAWPRFGREALAIPGAALLWIVLPSRMPFIARAAVPAKKGQD